jgi:catechol 2,3-dioxygenase-like lactoylglutathione lyase family enzyme
MIDLDHVALAVPDLEPVLEGLTSRLGATILLGQEGRGFRFVYTRVGDGERGMNLEVLEPWNVPVNDFLARFLDDDGEGPHHLTFVVPNVEEVSDALAKIGRQTVKTDLSNPAWREAFLMPEDAHGTVVQIADATAERPPMHEMMGATSDASEAETIPPPWTVATDRTRWWGRYNPGPRRAFLERVVLTTTDMFDAKLLFAQTLGGTLIAEGSDWAEYGWPAGARLLLQVGTTCGIARLEISGNGFSDPFVIGGATFTPRPA